MQSFLIANPKGGVGKSTLATNLAGWFARRGHAVMLGDIDRQQSSREWLKIRPAGLPHIATWEIVADRPARPPKETSHVVLDTVGPILLGAAKPVHILTPTATVRRLVNMTALGVVDANHLRE